MERVTRDALRAMAIGETRTFDLPNAQACDNGKSGTYSGTSVYKVLIEFHIFFLR